MRSVKVSETKTTIHCETIVCDIHLNSLHDLSSKTKITAAATDVNGKKSTEELLAELAGRDNSALGPPEIAEVYIAPSDKHSTVMVYARHSSAEVRRSSHRNNIPRV